jgi:FKBP12-rapamycin complex-associated protein
MREKNIDGILLFNHFFFSFRQIRRLAAVLSIKELAKNAPGTFYSKMNQTVMNQGGTHEFLHQLLPVLRDAQPIVRACGADALAECLKIIVDPSRKHHSTTEILCQIYSFVMDGFTIHNRGSKGVGNSSIQATQAQVEAAQHSSLLIVGDLLERSGSFMLPRFDEVCKSVLALRSHPKELIRLEVVRLIVSMHIFIMFCSYFVHNLIKNVFGLKATTSQKLPRSIHEEISWIKFKLYNGLRVN